MANIALMLLGLLLLSGLAYWYYHFTQMSSLAGLAAAICTVVLALTVAAKGNAFAPAAYALYALGALGALLFAWPRRALPGVLKGMGKGRGAFFSPAYIAVVAVFLYALVALRGVNVYTCDALTLWARTTRIMLETGAVPAETMGYPIGSPLFGYFFLRLTGLVDSNMNAASFVLWFAPLMLPLGDMRWKRWKSVLLYALGFFIAIYSLYKYSYQTIMVDLSFCCMAGGLCAWWLFKEKRARSDYALAGLAIAAILCLDKGNAMFFAAFCAAFVVLVQRWRGERVGVGRHGSRRRLPRFAVAGIALGVVALVVAALFAFYDVGSLAQGLFGAGDKLQATFEACLKGVFNKNFSSVSALKITYGTGLLFIGIVSYLAKKLMEDGRAARIYGRVMIVYFAGAFLYFAVVVLYYSAAFVEQYSAMAHHVERFYMAYIIPGILLAIVPLFRRDAMPTRANRLIATVLSCAVCAVSFAGINAKFVTYATNLDKTGLTNYEVVMQARASARALADYVGEEDQVYMISQYPERNNGGAEIDAALYELGYPRMQQKFTYTYYFAEDAFDKYQVTNFSVEYMRELLETGRYAYVWVFRTDEFLDGKFDEVFGVSDLKNGNLYHVLPGEGGIRLEFVDKVLRPYTNSVK